MFVAAKVAKKFLMHEPFFVDGFEYQFISVEPHEDWAIDVVVNVVLPKKGQSFVVEKFSYDIHHLIEKFGDYFGSGISYNEKILVDGKPVPEKGVYINEEDQDEIINSLNGNMSNFSIMHMNTNYDTYRVRGGLTWEKPNKRFYKVNYEGYDEIDFYFYYDVSDVVVNNGELNVNPTKINEFASTLNDRLQDNDQFRDKIVDNIYMVLEPSTKIENLKVYFNANYFLKRINGEEYNPTSPEMGFKWNMFIE
jgi:hypothetical protein